MLTFEKADSEVNARIVPLEGDDFVFAIVGRGTIKRQNEIGQKIVRAYNSHDALLAACKAALGAFEHRHAIDWDDLQRAIDLAEGKSP